jgi:hypothetical protein
MWKGTAISRSGELFKFTLGLHLAEVAYFYREAKEKKELSSDMKRILAVVPLIPLLLLSMRARYQ